MKPRQMYSRRWRILPACGLRSNCVCEFVAAIDADFSTVSKHLSILKQAGIVEDEKRGKKVFYRLRTTCVLGFMSCIDGMTKNHVEEQVITFA